MILVRDQIEELQRELGGVVKETTPSTPAPGAVPAGERINFSEQVVLLETSFHSLSAQEEALRKQVDVLRQSLSGLSRRSRNTVGWCVRSTAIAVSTRCYRTS